MDGIEERGRSFGEVESGILGNFNGSCGYLIFKKIRMKMRNSWALLLFLKKKYFY